MNYPPSMARPTFDAHPWSSASAEDDREASGLMDPDAFLGGECF